jgi:hypothetical protein
MLGKINLTTRITVALRPVRLTTVIVEDHYVLYIPRVCMYP